MMNTVSDEYNVVSFWGGCWFEILMILYLF